MTTECPYDPFEPIHKKFIIKNEKDVEYEQLPYLNNISFRVTQKCDAKLVGRYSYALQETASIRGLSNLKIFIYPGTICEINGHERVFAILGRTVYCPGQICENYNNPKAFIEVTAMANFLQCLLSVDRIEAGKPYVHHKDVITLAKTIFGEPISEDIKTYYEII